jgi:WXG100 family type VII secretion target
MSTISAQQGALNKGANAVKDAKAGIDQQVKMVRGEIEQLKSFWSGSAATAFNGLMTSWDSQTSKLNAVLVTLEDSLRTTEKTQAADEESHQSTISNLGSMMSGS